MEWRSPWRRPRWPRSEGRPQGLFAAVASSSETRAPSWRKPVDSTRGQSQTLLLIRILKIAGLLVAVLIVADLVGVFVSFILDVAPARHKSAGLGYAIWLVLGVFAGLIFGASAVSLAAGREPDVEWTDHPQARSIANVIRVVTAVALAVLAVAFWVLFWSGAGAREFAVVPDHMPTTIVFFLAFMGGAWLGSGSMVPAPGGPGGGTDSPG